MKNLRLNFNLQAKLLIILILFSLVLTTAVSIGLNVVLSKRFDSYIRSNFKSRVESISDEIRSAYIQAGSWKNVKLGELNLGKSMGLEVIVTDLNGEPIMSVSRHMAGHSAQMMKHVHQMMNVGGVSATTPLSVKGKKIALIKVNSMMEGGGLWSQQDIDFKNRLNLIIFMVSIAAFLLAIVISFLVSRAFIKPINSLSAAAKTWGEGKFDVKAVVQSDDEIGSLSRIFNGMAANLARQQKERQNMLADISHELRTPLSVLQNNIEALQDGVIDPTRDNIQNIHDEVLRLNHLIDDLQTLALTDSTNLKLKKTEVNLFSLVKEVAENLDVFLKTKNIKFSIEGGASINVKADALRLKQIIFNLVFNAYKYVGANGKIKIRIEKDQGKTKIIIQDDGTGISAADLPHIFDRFYSAKDKGGTGIGLAVVKRLVEAHDGSIDVESAAHKGSSFTILLP